MNLENIEAFVYVIHYGSFNKAAEVLYLSQPSVTARIQSLERELDCKLFDRWGKQTALTEEGKRFLPYAQQILQTLQKGKLQLQSKRALPNELRIGCTVSVSNYVIPELLPALQDRFPGVHMKLTTAVTDDIVGKILNEELDIGLVRNVHHPNLKSVKYYEDPIRLYVYRGHPLAETQGLTLEAIGQYPLVFFECGALDWLRIHRLFESLDQPPNIAVHSDNLEMAKKLVLKQRGICFLPSLCTHQEVRDGTLIPIDLPELSSISLQTNLISLNGESSFHQAFAELAGKLPLLPKYQD